MSKIKSYYWEEIAEEEDDDEGKQDGRNTKRN